MRAIDTNVLVRLVARDDPKQLQIAREIILTGDVLILPTVLLEAAWVLRTRYRLGRAECVERLAAACSQPGVILAYSAAVYDALTAYADGGDFADLLHAALAAEHGADAIVTFDRSFASAANIPVQVIGL
jgi:predicted nucleic-acid-binding protein